MELFRTTREVTAWSASLRRQGRTIAFVPTMGYLHEGHLSLMRAARGRADQVAVSIFVNPTQFGPKEDLSRYPRDLDGDLSKCRSAGVDAVFAPADEKELYPTGAQTFVEVTQVSQGLCGEKRPGHFRGVATVVTKLFNAVQPHLALFGEKDYQQLQVLKAMTRDLLLPIEIVGLPTVRERDGLAMSSRNAYLSPDERGRALALSRGLFAAQKAVAAGERSAAALVQTVRAELLASSLREDYVACVDSSSLRPLDTVTPGSGRLLVAAFCGTTRLIDNVGL